jgi:branched-chain amino acid transport system substrate-binding protein
MNKNFIFFIGLIILSPSAAANFYEDAGFCIGAAWAMQKIVPKSGDNMSRVGAENVLKITRDLAIFDKWVPKREECLKRDTKREAFRSCLDNNISDPNAAKFWFGYTAALAATLQKSHLEAVFDANTVCVAMSDALSEFRNGKLQEPSKEPLRDTAGNMNQNDTRAKSVRSNVVSIGHTGPTSGPLAHLGKDTENGVRLAVEEFNASGITLDGKAVAIELIALDDGADPRQAVTVAQRLIDTRVSGVIGHLTSGASIPAAKLYNGAGIPQISPTATNPRLTRLGYSTAFRLSADDFHLATLLATYSIKTLVGRKFAIVYEETEFGRGKAEQYAKDVASLGGDIIAIESINDNVREVGRIIDSIRSKRPDIIFFGGMEDTAISIVRQLKKLRIESKFMGGDIICTDDFAKKVYGATSSVQVYCAEAGGVERKYVNSANEFKRKFKARFGQEAQEYAPYAYDAAKIMIAAMIKANSSDPKKYLPYLAATKDYVGATGPITFDKSGNLKSGAITIKSIKGAKLEVVAVLR